MFFVIEKREEKKQSRKDGLGWNKVSTETKATLRRMIGILATVKSPIACPIILMEKVS
jgi:hypothetical protein